MPDLGGRPVITAAVVAVLLGIVQFVIYGIWIGGVAKQLDHNTEWIKERSGLQGEARIAVVENRLEAIDEHLRSIDRQLEARP